MDETLPTARARLSERQRQCLDLVGQGFTSKEIGRQIGLSPSTVDNHIRAALERLGMTDRASAARAMSALTAGDDGASARPEATAPLPSFFALPPLGGAVNRLSARRRVWHIVQIALLGIMGMTAVVITISGLVNLFSR
jgi:DNA-binding CsgD family transcriptional regulator